MLKKSRREEIHGRTVQNDLNELDDYNGMVSHPEPDTLEWKVKQALKSIAANKANGWHEIPAELFKSLKDDAIRVLHSLCPQIWKTQQWPQDWKRSILIPIPKKGSTKECAGHSLNVLDQRIVTGQLHSSPMLVRSCLKSCILCFAIMQTKNFQISKLGLEKEEELEIKLPTFTGL